MNGIYPKLLQVSFSCSVCEDHQPSDQQGVTPALVVWVTTSHVCFTTTSSAQWESVLVVGSQQFAQIGNYFYYLEKPLSISPSKHNQFKIRKKCRDISTFA